jgi:hypothetical protein
MKSPGFADVFWFSECKIHYLGNLFRKLFMFWGVLKQVQGFGFGMGEWRISHEQK